MNKSIVIVGGKLQGTEAAYLCREGGIYVTLIDIDPETPAQKLCNNFICGDVLSDDPEIVRALDSADMILPTMENYDVLEGLVSLCSEKGYVLAFDMEAYKITSSKKKSDRLFADNGIPCPGYYPEGKLPYFAKPESESGSHNVRKFENTPEDAKAFEGFVRERGKDFVIQEYVEGPSYSVEIIGEPGNYRTYEITQIFIDNVYDCNLAAAYRDIVPEKKEAIRGYAVKIAEILGLRGIMDLEVIATDRGDGPDGLGIKVLEMDARLPSQTSVAVYHATGMNYINELYDLFVHGDFRSPVTDEGQCAAYYNYLVDDTGASKLGEHIMTEGGLLMYNDDMFEEARVVSDWQPGCNKWRGIFVSWADTAEECRKKEEAIWKHIQ